MSMPLAAFLIAAALPLLLLYVIFTLDLYGSGSPRNVALCFAWGSLSVFLAFAFYEQLFAMTALSGATIASLLAPVVEETLKALILLYLVRRASFTYFVDGAVYGFAAGIGFAVVENVLYLLQSGDPTLGAALSRVISTNLMHASASAAVGMALGFARFRRFSHRALFLAGGLLLAIAIHTGYNALVRAADGRFLLLYATAAGAAGMGFVVLTMRRGLAEQRRWIRTHLGRDDGVTPAETAAVDRLDDVQALLAPLVTIFGAEKASQIESFLLLQARIGIQRRTLAALPADDRARAAIERQIQGLRQEMDAARRAVGAYTMIALRSLVPPTDTDLWDRLQAAVSERGTREQTGASLFTLAGTRAAERANRSGTNSSEEAHKQP